MLRLFSAWTGRDRARGSGPPGPRPAWPAVFHVTHHKAGSQWLHKILDNLAHDRVVPPESKPFVQLYRFLLNKLSPPADTGRLVPRRKICSKFRFSTPCYNGLRRII